MWVKYKSMEAMEQFFQWDERQLAVGELSTSYLEIPWDIYSRMLKTQSYKESF